MNSVNVIGTVKSTPKSWWINGRKIINFRLLEESEYFDRQGDQKKKKNILEIMAWGLWVPKMEQETNVGDRLAIVGSLQTAYYSNQQGKRYAKLEIVANDIIKMNN